MQRNAVILHCWLLSCALQVSTACAVGLEAGPHDRDATPHDHEATRHDHDATPQDYDATPQDRDSTAHNPTKSRKILQSHHGHSVRKHGASRLSTRKHGHHESAPDGAHDLDVTSLPDTKQSHNRVLAAVTAATHIRDAALARLLDGYVAMCEAGFEVHVVLVTYESWVNNTAGVYEKTRYLCTRLGSDLPIVTWIDENRASLHLAAQHRKAFAALKDRYDYYVSQEDDMMLLPKHMLYFQKWITLFAGTNLYPGFAVMEVPTSLHSVSDLYGNAPMTWNPFVGGYVRNLHVVRMGGTISMVHAKAWVPLYILTRTMLEQAMARPAWTLDEHKPWKEYNTHFQHVWLTRYYRVVVPVEDIMTSFIHHAPNKYVNLDIAKYHPKDTTLETAALAQLVGACVSSFDDSDPKTDAHLVDSMLHRCTECLLANKTAAVEFQFPGTPDSGPSDHHSPPQVDVSCIESDAIPRQEISGCNDTVDQQVCEDGT